MPSSQLTALCHVGWDCGSRSPQERRTSLGGPSGPLAPYGSQTKYVRTHMQAVDSAATKSG